jgi:hypothetical protein
MDLAHDRAIYRLATRRSNAAAAPTHSQPARLTDERHPRSNRRLNTEPEILGTCRTVGLILATSPTVRRLTNRSIGMDWAGTAVLSRNISFIPEININPRWRGWRRTTCTPAQKGVHPLSRLRFPTGVKSTQKPPASDIDANPTKPITKP